MSGVKSHLANLLDPLIVRFAGQEQLARIARSGESPLLRLAAVAKLHDSEALAEIAKRDEDLRVWKAAFDRLPEGEVRRRTAAYLDAAAARRLTSADPDVLVDVARTARGTPQRLAAVKNSHFVDQNVLAEIAISDEDEDVRLAAVERLTDPNRLSEIARGQASTVQAGRRDYRNFKARIAAVGKLTDQGTILEIAAHDPDPALRAAAARKALDQGVLTDLALHDPDEAVRIAAVEGLEALDTVAGIARADASAPVRRAAVERLSDGNDLEAIAAADPDPRVRLRAILKARYGGNPQAFLTNLLDGSAAPEVKEERIRSLWTVIQTNREVPARDIVFCRCGYPTAQVFSDGTSGPIAELACAETDPFEEYTTHYRCPRCHQLIDTVTL